jgi:UDP-glucose 4-epimerase
MKILITGSSGFIGRNICEYFGAKFEVSAPAHTELELLDEAAVAAYLKDKHFDVIIHAAVRPGHRNANDPSNQLDRNTRMFFNLIRNSESFKKIIVLSSGLVYDQRFYLPKMKEEYFDTHVPVDESGFSKYIIAKHIEKMDNALELRVFGIFGKYEDYAIRFISNAVCKAIFGLPITIKENRKFDYLYIDDLMTIIDFFIEHKPEFKAYNLTPDSSIELSSLAEKIKKITAKDLPIIIKAASTGIEYSGDNSRIKKEMGNLKFTPLDEAIKELYSWYSGNKHLLRKELLLVDK